MRRLSLGVAALALACGGERANVMSPANVAAGTNAASSDAGPKPQAAPRTGPAGVPHSSDVVEAVADASGSAAISRDSVGGVRFGTISKWRNWFYVHLAAPSRNSMEIPGGSI